LVILCWICGKVRGNLDIDQQHEQEQKQPLDEQLLQNLTGEGDGAATEVSVVRTNTPRPLSFARSASKKERAAAAESYPSPADFPVEAPAAPPLPEEPDDSESGAPVATASLLFPITTGQADATAPEFTWLFEYGLEMDRDYLNGSTRLNGQAYIYGPAVLKGYRIEGIVLQNGQTAITLAKASFPEQEVWGILYRIPRLLAEQNGAGLSVLDKVHGANQFTATPVVVEEIYRKRMIQCITYMLSETARKGLASSAPVGAHLDRPYVLRLLEVARQQKLPEAYLQELATLVEKEAREPSTIVPTRIEQNTEPLPVVDSSSLSEQVSAIAQNTESTPTPGGWLLALALYLVGVLMAALALAVIQTLGYWNQLFAANFAPLGAPWYVLLYGLLGGCMSCMMTLGRSTRPVLPGFVILTWFARPFLGMALAALAYLVVSSGLFAMSAVPAQRYAIFSVVGAVAGLCEGWLFFRKK
jgi:hypothetical protein